MTKTAVTKKIPLKPSLLVMLSTLCLLCTTQCHWSDPPPTDTIVFGLGSEPKSLDPRFATDANGQRLLKLVFSSLVRIGPDLNVIGDLATTWEYNNLTYSFQIRPNVFFHDGSALTYEDLEYSIKEFKKNSSPFAAQFEIIKDISGHYDVKSGGALHLKLSQFSASLLNDLPSLVIMPKSILKKMGDNFYQTPIGSGPFILEKRDLKNIFLSRFNNFYSEKSKTERVQFKIIKDSNTRFQKMYKGKIDIVQSDVPFSKIKVFKKSEKFDVTVQPGLSTTYILLNLRNPILEQKEIRHAISQSINREELIKYTHEGFAEPATSILTKANPFHLKGLKPNIMSKEQLKKIFLNLKDKPIILKTSNTQEAIENGRVLTHQLKSMGLNVEQQSYEWGTYYEDVRTGKFDMAVMKWVGINNPDIYRVSLHSKMTPPGRNRGYYNNPKLDHLVDTAIKEPTLEKRKTLYHQAQKLVFKDLPTIPLWYEKQIAITHKRVKNYSLPLNGDFSALMKVYKENDDTK